MKSKSRTKRVMMLHGSSDLYGASKIFLFTASILKESGVYVIVILSEEGPLADELRKLGVQVKLIRLGIIRRKYFNAKGLINRVKVIFKAYKQLGELAKAENITHIYSNTAAVWVGAFLSRVKGYTHVWHLHEIIVKPKFFSLWMGKLVQYNSDRVIVVSQAVKNHWEKYVSGNKLQLIYNGIDYNPYLCQSVGLRKELGIPEEAMVIGMIGRVNSWKGQEYFLEISEELNKKFLNLYFLLIGDAFPGEEHLFEGLEQRILEKEFSDRIYNLGFRKDISDVLATMDIFILPSILPDPFPTVILEAMAAAKPVVATAQGGALEMIDHGTTGYHIPLHKASESAAIIGDLIGNKSQINRIGKEARKSVVGNFSLSKYRQEILSIFS
ncbi:glycosyltransferase family 4 protein [Cyclobacterium sp. 1_MG-2023]|uniref:glycosyltransferase family 4 protein n=1 Tax=Cyclobacterium sp. 1_MG-2023 TaxID=3062681 RepID=UPI0026E11FD7|nr:glycosyltransferase family 4 protein [Cyclobacterium sp. 1_MG-2023]MDO6439633.1 glycosyltransferase family 4 protein [Cyclobacterium sp. 1_MG-2023]